MKITTYVTSFLAVLALASFSAAAAPSLELTTTVQQQKTTVDAKGAKHTAIGPVERALPGNEFVYTITYRNTGKQPAGDVVINDPIPEHTVYVGDSAEGKGMTITFSIDGGKTWGKPEELRIKNADGTTTDALPRDYTNIRWVLNGKLAPGAQGTVSFHAILQ